MTYQEIVGFHGHACPGLAIGYRMSLAGLEALASVRATDEELVAITENDACGVDALQCLTGCTFGKGNLRFRDYGKSVYTLYCRTTLRGVRVLFHGGGFPEELRDDREARMAWILSAPEEEMISVTPVTLEEPEPAAVHRTVSCSVCGEGVMETRLRDGMCVPCRESKNAGSAIG